MSKVIYVIGAVCILRGLFLLVSGTKGLGALNFSSIYVITVGFSVVVLGYVIDILEDIRDAVIDRDETAP